MSIQELHNIMPIANIPSVLEYGILSHNLRKKFAVPNHSVALPEVQVRRVGKIVTDRKTLHDYANLYFDAHNPMLSRVREHNEVICVLRVSSEVLKLPGVVISDRNAAADYAGFYPYPAGLEKLDFELIYATFWIHRDDPMLEDRHKRIKCAEVLVPGSIEPNYIIGAYVFNQQAENSLKQVGFSGKITINSALFF